MTVSAFVSNYYLPILFFGLFAFFHSFFAREETRAFLTRSTSEFFMTYFWRATYCVLSLVLLYLPLIAGLHHVDPIFRQPLLVYPSWLKAVVSLLHLVGAGLQGFALLQFDFFEFFGVKPLITGIRALVSGRRPAVPPRYAGLDRLEIHGIYRFVRHPQLTGAMLLVLPRQFSVQLLVLFALVALYCVIGHVFEERRLIRAFGSDYVAYRKRVPAFIPRFAEANGT